MAKKAVGSLRYDLVVNSKPFAKGVDKAKTHAHGLSGAIKGINVKMAAFAGVAVAGAFVAAVSRIVSKQLELVDALGKTASSLDITVAQYQALSHSARKAGVDQEKLGKALADMSSNIGKAAQGSGGAANAIEQLGLSVDSLMEMSPAQQFEEIARGFSSMENASERLQIAREIFSDTGDALINMLDGGSKAIEGARDQLDKFGATLSEESVSAIEAANDAMADTSLIMQGFEQDLTIAIVPALRAAAEVTQEFSDKISIMGSEDGAMSGMGELAVFVLGMIGDAVQGVQIALNRLAVAWNAVSFAMASVEGNQKEINRLIKDGILLNKEYAELSELSFSTRLKQSYKLAKAEMRLASFVKERARAERKAREEAKEDEEGEDPDSKYKNSLLDKISDLRSAISDFNRAKSDVILDEFIDQKKLLYDAREFGIISEEVAQKLYDSAAKIRDAKLDAIKEMGNGAGAGDGAGDDDEGMVPGSTTAGDILATRMVEEFETQEDAIRAHYQRRLKIATEGYEKLGIARLTYTDYVKNLEREKNEAIASLDRQAWAGRLDTAAQFINVISSFMSAHDKKSFKRLQKVRMAEAAIHTASSAIKAFDNAGGWPWGIVPAFLSVAAGAAQIAKISRQQYNGAPTAASGFGSGGGGGAVAGVASDTASSGALLSDEQRGDEFGQPADKQTIQLVGRPEDRVTLDEIQELFREANEKNILIQGVTYSDG